ncbi:retrovirus-related pol polyprotein from transposon TNT 1-94 [Tanacetum coccineum]|uniref:Retrovirus-related pol polyprotein from transposon TNT 1-94 n=1 Tax=Tanacetum coccineum TaxID=301880 RepID=A0ABQ5B0L2_9ASTR
MYDGKRLHNTKLIIDSPDYEKTLKDAEESRLKMKNKMIQLNYEKLNALYETFVPQKNFLLSKLIFQLLLLLMYLLNEAILALRTNIDVTLLKDERKIYIDDGQNTLRQFYKTDVIRTSLSLTKHSKELKQELTEEKNEILMLEKEKISSDSKDIQANLLKRIKILENDFKQSQAQSIDFELKLQHQKEKMACDNSWNSKLTKLRVESSNSVKRPKSKDTKSKNRVLKNTNVKSPSTNDWKVQVVKDVFMLSHEKCVARYALFVDSKVKRAIFTSPVAAKSRNLGATLVVEKSRPIRVASINGKRYILVIVDDYSRYTWVFFLHTKDEALDMIINFITQIQRSLKAQVLKVWSDNGIEFKNEKLRTFYAKLGITHSTSIVRTPKQNGVVERRNQSSLVHTRYNKTPYELIKGRTPYELIKGRKPNVQYFHVFGSLCYPTNDRGDLRKMKSKVDIDSSEDSQSVPSKEDLDNLFGPLYEEYYVTRTLEVSNDSAANTLDNEDTPSSSSIVVEENEAHQIVTSLEEPIDNEATTLVSTENANKQA